MNLRSPNTRNLFVALLGCIFVAGLLALFFIPFRLVSEMQLNTWAEYAGKLQAKVWFDEDHYRLLELSSNNKTEFTRRKDGQFEIWTWSHYTNSSWLVTGDPDRVFVDAFNQRMKQLCNEKNKEQK